MSAKSIHVLHVDDAPDFADLTATSLEREDERITMQTATSAEEGRSRLAHEQFDCIVSDYDMPGQNGIEFLEAVRDEYPDIPFILYTGKGSEEVASDAISAGVTDYLQKEGGTEQYALLANRIRNAVEQARANKRVSRQHRINSAVQQINEALARTTTRSEIDERVCETLSDAEPYRFAWIGEHDPESQTVVPRTAAGIGEDYLDGIEITTTLEATGQGPTGRAIRNGDLAVMQNIPEDPRYEPWREAALERGYRSSAALPFIYDDTLYGVLNVYADRSHAFDEHERQLLSNLGETIAHAYHRVALKQQYTDQYRILFEEAPVMIIFTRTVDGEPIIEDCNQAVTERLGYTREELCETPLADYYTDESTEQLLGEHGYQRALSGEFVHEQRTLMTRDGEEILTILRASPRRDQDGEILGTFALYLDITDEQQVRELRRQNERLDEFVGVVSHDLRNPLNVARLRLDLLADECDSDNIEHVKRAHDRIEALIDDLLALARQGDAVSDRDSIDVEVLVKGCWENVETNGATLVVDSTRRIRADESRLKQVFENLFRNAVEHGGEDVTVTVGELPDGVYVGDDGPGIPEDERDAIFEAGYSTNHDGTGFGLSIVNQVVDAHGWEIHATQGTEGGARFEITGIERSEW